MEDEFLSFIREHTLRPFSEAPAPADTSLPLRTKDAKAIYTRLIRHLSSDMRFGATRLLWQCCAPIQDMALLSRRQRYFSSLPTLHPLPVLRMGGTWKPRYSLTLVTEDEDTYLQCKAKGYPIQLLSTAQDLQGLEAYDVVQAISCEVLSGHLESLENCVDITPDRAYLERHLIQLSPWAPILESLATLSFFHDEVSQLLPLLPLFAGSAKPTTRAELEQKLSQAQHQVDEQLKAMVISGDALVALISRQQMPDNVKRVIADALKGAELKPELVAEGFPLHLDEEAVEGYLRSQSVSASMTLAQRIYRQGSAIARIPQLLQRLEEKLILYDFLLAVQKCSIHAHMPTLDAAFSMEGCSNIFLEHAQPITFSLHAGISCSILTGANSGGKTTLLEHIVQVVLLAQMGLPVSGKVSVPLYTDIYYFAKNKGSANKGAFETLLQQMAKIKPGKGTLILADEIEAVTEPGVAADVIRATISYYLAQACQLVVATHLGKELQHAMPTGARMDGIEAKGLTDDFQLIVDHNPVMGRLAHSTPELIIERLAKKEIIENKLFLKPLQELRNTSYS